MNTEQIILQLVQRIDAMEKELLFLRRIKTFKLGTGDTSISMDRQGLWVGKNSFTDATTSPYTATSIAINGDFTPKGGVTGSFAADGGSPSVTVTRGIITSIV